MVKHLEHLEDQILNFCRPDVTEAEISEYFDMIRNIQDAAITLKVDGSLSIVFGKTDASSKFFISTKSYFNKTPKLAYSEEDIRSLFNPHIQDDLIVLFEEIKKTFSKSSYGVYQADVMFVLDKPSKQASRIVQPNVTKYKFNLHPYSPTRVGIYVHQYITDGNWKSFGGSSKIAIFAKDTCFYVDANPKLMSFALRGLEDMTIKSTKYFYDEHSGHLKQFFNYLIKTSDIDYLNLDVDTNKKASARSLVLKYISFMESKDIGSNLLGFSVIENIFEVYLSILDIKGILIEIMTDELMYINRIEVLENNEGFVLDYDGNKYKLVDRLKFSYANFKKHDELISVSN